MKKVSATTLKRAIELNNYNAPCLHPLWSTPGRVAYSNPQPGCAHLTEYYFKQSCQRCGFLRTVGIPPKIELVEEMDDDE